MTVSTHIPATIQMRRSRLFGLVAAVALVAAGITSALLIFAVDPDNGATRSSQPAVSSPSLSDQSYVKGITSLTPAQQAAAFGGQRAVQEAAGFKQFAKGISSTARAQQVGAVLGALGLDAQDRQYVQGITSLTPAQQAVAFGGQRAVQNAAGFEQFAKGISSMARAQQTAAVLDALGLDAQDRQYVLGVISLTPEQQAAAYGR